MKHGFIKVAAATPEIKVADCIWNGEQTIKLIEEAENLGVILVASLFLTPTAHLSPNPVDYTSKIYLSFICFSLLPLLMSKTIIRSHLDP